MILPGAGLASPTGRMDIGQGSGGSGTLSQRLDYLPVSPFSILFLSSSLSTRLCPKAEPPLTLTEH